MKAAFSGLWSLVKYNKILYTMTTIIRIYPIIDGQETCVREPQEIVRFLSNPDQEIDLDFSTGSSVKMGSSRDFIGETVQVGEDLEIEIPEH